MKKNGASPQEFLNFCNAFKEIFDKIVKTSGGQSKHLLAGLEKLDYARRSVDEIQKNCAV